MQDIVTWSEHLLKIYNNLLLDIKYPIVPVLENEKDTTFNNQYANEKNKPSTMSRMRFRYK